MTDAVREGYRGAVKEVTCSTYPAIWIGDEYRQAAPNAWIRQVSSFDENGNLITVKNYAMVDSFFRDSSGLLVKDFENDEGHLSYNFYEWKDGSHYTKKNHPFFADSLYPELKHTSYTLDSSCRVAETSEYLPSMGNSTPDNKFRYIRKGDTTFLQAILSGNQVANTSSTVVLARDENGNPVKELYTAYDGAITRYLVIYSYIYQ